MAAGVRELQPGSGEVGGQPAEVSDGVSGLWLDWPWLVAGAN